MPGLLYSDSTIDERLKLLAAPPQPSGLLRVQKEDARRAMPLLRALLCASYRLLRAMATHFSLVQKALVPHVSKTFLPHTEAHLVASELIRTAALWSEQWQEALTEASALYFGSGDVDGMIATLEPYHPRRVPPLPKRCNDAQQRDVSRDWKS